ncbi:MAG: hypothetical protein K6A36_02660 [Paludibacteraceae bacterium]|nr:hypothetical protein [Paludibacteraceae bacterium]
MVRKMFFIGSLLLISVAACVAKPKPLVFNGDTLIENDEYKRSQCGTLKKGVGLVEISGIACSRVTPGYIWMESDDYSDCIIAADEKGTTRHKLVEFTTKINRNDWEDMCGGVYNGKNYLFIGAFGDNEASKGNYQIIYFEEPEITGAKSIKVTPSIIKFQYPEGIMHNAESMMYDNVEQKLYIVTKVYYDVNQVFCLPFRLDYGDEVQTLEYVCDLGVKSDLGEGASPFRGFHLATAADISPDGSRILIKNHNNTSATFSWTLLWKREGSESISETLKRQPEVIKSYMSEWQGEAICWLDNNVFFTVSDDGGEPPIYRYVKPYPEAIENISGDNIAATKIMRDGQLIILRGEKAYTVSGTEIR